MRVKKEIYDKIKKEVENDLRNYPYYLISIEAPGLGSATRPDVIINRSSISDSVGNGVVDMEFKRIMVNAINYVYDKLDGEGKKIIDHSYFRDDKTNKEVMEELKIDKNKFYKVKDKTLYKFAVGLGYC